jgi:hypothetical protein
VLNSQWRTVVPGAPSHDWRTGWQDWLTLSEIVQSLDCSRAGRVVSVRRMRSIWRVAGVVVHLLLIAAAVVAVVVRTSHPAYPPLRAALIGLVVVVSVVTVLGRLPLGLGPAAGSMAAATVRLVGIVLAGVGAVEVVLGLAQGGSPSQRAFSGVPLSTVVLAVYLAAFLAVTRHEGGLAPRAMLTSVGLGLLAATLFAGAVPVLPPGLLWWVGFLLIAAAAAGAARLIRPAPTGSQAALLTIVTACQALFLAAAVLYQYGPDAWMPYAGPGPLTVQGQLEQNRAEAIDPYAGLLFIGALAATFLTGQAVTARLRTRHKNPSAALATG